MGTYISISELKFLIIIIEVAFLVLMQIYVYRIYYVK